MHPSVVLSPVLFTNMTSCFASYICSLPLGKLCIQCDVAYTICLNYVLCLFSFCAGTHSCTRGHTHLENWHCLCMRVCLHPGLQPLACCDAPSSLLNLFSSLSILIECSLDGFSVVSRSGKKTHNFFLASHSSFTLLCVPSSGVEDPSMRKTGLNRWSRSTAGLPCCYTAFLPNQRSHLSLQLLYSHTPCHLYVLQIVCQCV